MWIRIKGLFIPLSLLWRDFWHFNQLFNYFFPDLEKENQPYWGGWLHLLWIPKIPRCSRFKYAWFNIGLDWTEGDCWGWRRYALYRAPLRDSYHVTEVISEHFNIWKRWTSRSHDFAYSVIKYIGSTLSPDSVKSSEVTCCRFKVNTRKRRVKKRQIIQNKTTVHVHRWPVHTLGLASAHVLYVTRVLCNLSTHDQTDLQEKTTERAVKTWMSHCLIKPRLMITQPWKWETSANKAHVQFTGDNQILYASVYHRFNKPAERVSRHGQRMTTCFIHRMCMWMQLCRL